MSHIPKIKCAYCGKVFQQWSGNPQKSHWRRKFCSEKCRYQAQRKGITGFKACLYCGKNFPYRDSLKEHGWDGVASVRAKFCSRLCNSIFQGKNKRHVHVNDETKKKISAKIKGRKVTWGHKISQAIKGGKHWNWKGDYAGYYALHYRVRKTLGNPKQCDICNASNPKQRYEWANLTGKYSQISDYKRMCKFCHRKYDLKCGGKPSKKSAIR